jgi:3-isopropylmalate/(R)-2-methylmalate dehydratase large subunit
VFTGREDDARQTAIGREFAKLHGIEKPWYADPGDGIFHFYFPEQGLVLPGQFIPGADSHSRAYGAYGAVGFGVGSTTLGFGWSTGYIYFTLAKQRRVVFRGRLQPWVSGKDVVLELLRRWGAKQSQGMSVELVDADRQLPIAFRNTIANMMAEGEALNGIFAEDDVTDAWYAEKGIRSADRPYPRVAPGADAVYEIDETLELSGIAPMIAKPFSPGNAFPADEVARERIQFDKAMIGSCTNGGYDDLLSAALVLRAARGAGFKQTARTFTVFPGSGGVARQIEVADPRLGGESIAEVFRSVGGQIRQSWCGPCFGQGPDALTQGQRAITSFNRNWQNRMGLGGEGYLASPAVVAASALAGYMAPPSSSASRGTRNGSGSKPNKLLRRFETRVSGCWFLVVWFETTNQEPVTGSGLSGSGASVSAKRPLPSLRWLLVSAFCSTLQPVTRGPETRNPCVFSAALRQLIVRDRALTRKVRVANAPFLEAGRGIGAPDRDDVSRKFGRLRGKAAVAGGRRGGASPKFMRAAPGERIPGQYIVLLADETLPGESVPFVASELAAEHGGSVRVTLQNAVRGFTANLTEEQALRLAEDPRVRLVEENAKAHLSSEQVLPPDNSLWNLDRVDQRTAIGSGDDRYRTARRRARSSSTRSTRGSTRNTPSS